MTQAENTFSTTSVGDRFAQVELEPARTGGTTMHVTITSPGGAFDRADEITVSIESPSAGLGPLGIETVTVSPNHVIADDAVFPVPGEWTVQVVARYREFDRVVFDVDVDVPR